MNNSKDIMHEILYMESLRPDNGYEVDFAVGTTFSMSMEGLLSVPLALSKMGEQKAFSPQTAMYMMEGVRRASKKFVLFCNKGSIHVPSNCQPLYSLMEKSVVEISDKAHPLTNFHPKLWVVKQKPIAGNKGNALIKVIIMSRNLTFSTDLDCAISISGNVVKDGANYRNAPLAAMLRDLSAEYDADEKRREKINALADDLMRVMSFDFEAPLSPTMYELHPNLSEKRYNTTALHKRLYGKRILVISPFITTDILRNITENNTSAYLVTRENNVTEEIIDMFKGNVYVPNSELVENEECNISLHAKMYLVEQENGAVYLYLGSANATRNAFCRNSEMTIGVRVNNATFNDLFCELVEKGNLYLKMSAPTVNQEEEMEKRKTECDMEHILRWAINSVSEAKIVKKQGEQTRPYEVALKIDRRNDSQYEITQCRGDYDINFRPLQSKNEWKKFGEESLCWCLALEDLSEFYVVKVSSKSAHEHSMERVFKAFSPTMDRFVQTRNERIINSIVKADNIMQYIEMMLSDFPEYTLEQWNQRKIKSLRKGESIYSNTSGISIYEQLLKASYDNPLRIVELKEVLNKLSEEYDEELTGMLRAFGVTLKGKKK